MTHAEAKAWIGKGYHNSGDAVKAARRKAAPADLAGHVSVADLPPSLDWRNTANIVTAVKDQASCGGCWSFSAAETLESHIALKTGKLYTFSEQQILSCTPNPNQCGGTGGCSGATQELAFDYISHTGITQEADWPYTARTGTCDKTKVRGRRRRSLIALSLLWWGTGDFWAIASAFIRCSVQAIYVVP